MPIMAMNAIRLKNFQLTVVWFKENKKPAKELIEMINSEVPIAFLMDSFKRFTKAGIIKKPPPAPTKPVKKPTANPIKTVVV